MLAARSLVVLTFASLSLLACGRMESTVAIELTDAPIDMATVSQVNVSLGKLEVQSSGGCPGMDGDGSHSRPRHGDRQGDPDGWITVNDKIGTIDLLALQNGVTAPLGEVSVMGPVNGIRMQIDAAGTNEVVLSDGKTCALDTSGATEALLSLGDAAAVEPMRGRKTTIVVDFVVNESVSEVATCSFKLAPVLTIARVDQVDAED